MSITSKIINSANILDNSIVNADINTAAAIDATKIADGSVSSAEFQYLDGVTSAIQTQLNAKQALDADLTAVAALTTTGIAVRTASDTWTTRDMVYPAAGLVITNSAGIAGNPTFSLANDLAALEALSTTNVFPVRTASDTWTTYTFSDWQTFTPTVTLVGGANNTVPVYTTNTGYWTRVANIVYVQVYLTGDGGNEGAGTGQMNIALPVTASANQPAYYVPVGTAFNNATFFNVIDGQIQASATTIELARINAGAFASFTGVDQNNATRSVRLSFSYMV
jgi:hypothetical protein